MNVPYGRLVAALAGIVAIVACILWLRSCGAAEPARQAASAKADTVRAEGQTQSAIDATGITANQMDAATAIDQQTRSNEDAIRKANGAGDAYLRALCVRPAYHNLPRCASVQ